ncbi:hypothetical protein NQ314_003853 [Rhamnusium bicolor]|uniref:Microtubule-associated protein 1A/B/S-like MBL-like domain-containing protein n=1 Tax=Rhamnusium bicolor TaxID=1586634 RepID=A0AAV8ZMN5_9CUCU|nr:hypothetical protein NQ314_003853 [Rhamnusium bicolor]
MADFSEAFQELEVQRVIRAYENSISLDLHCSPEGDWSRLPKEHFAKACKVRVNPTDVLTTGCDAALFGINGFNMLLDGGFSRKACFWDFVRHLDRLDAVLMTRLNNSNVGGISSVLRRKKQDAVYPQIGHFFCNIQERKAILSPDGDKDRDPLLISLLEEGQEIISNLRHLNLNPQVCYRDSEPINLYHKVGHGTLDMYVLSPAKDSKEVREFLQKWNQSDQKLFANSKSSREFSFPIQNLISIAALLVWQPANPNDTITRILFPGSSPQRKIFEGLDRLKNLEFIKHPVCTEKSLVPSSTLKKATKDSIIEKVISKEKVSIEKKENKIIENNLSVNGEIKEKTVKKSDSTESERSTRTKKIEDKIIENGEKPKAKPKPSKIRGEPQQKRKTIEKKSSPTTPKKTVENGETKKTDKTFPYCKTRSAKPPPAEPKPKVERKPISRRPKGTMKAPISPVKKLVNGVQKPDSISKKDISKLTPEEIQQMKAQELADLKEEQEAIKEIEAVFRKGEVHPVKDENLRKVKEVSIDEDKLEKEEYLIIEKEEIDHDSLDEKEPKEDETQKLARDSEESEKQRKLSAEEQVIEKHEKIEDQVNNTVIEAADIVKAKEEIIEAGKEPVITSPEEKPDVSSTDKKITDKEIEEEIKYVVDSQPDEKVSGNIKSGDTTTAPTLPEDERIPLDEIKEDSGQIIEEKHVKEETKEKEVPLIQLPPKTFETASKVPGVVGIRLDKQSHIRDIVKTPDEVADLPVHEEVDYEYTHELKTETKTNEIIEEKKDIKVDEKVQDFIKDSEETMGYLKEQAKGIEQEKDKDEVVQEQLKEIIEDVNKTSIMQEELKHLTDTVLQSEVALEKSILNDTEKSVAKEKLKSPIEIQQDKLDEQFKHLPDDELHQKDLIDEIQKSDTDLSKKMIEVEEKQDIKREPLPTEDTLEKAELETKEKFDLREESKEKTEAKERGGKEEPEQDIIGEKVTETEEAVDMKEVVKAEKKDIKDETESTELFKEVKPKESKEIIEEVIKEKGITNVESIDKGKSAEEIIEKKEEVTVSKEKAENEEKGEKSRNRLKETVEKDELKEDKTDVEEISKKRETKEQEEDKIDTKEKPLVNGEVLEAEKVKEKIDIESHKNLKKSDDAADNGTKSEKEDKVDKVDSEKKVEETQDTGKQVKSIERTELDPEKKDAEKNEEIIKATKEDKFHLEKIEEKLQHLKEISPEPRIETIEPKKLEEVSKIEKTELIKATMEDKAHLKKLEDKLLELKEAADTMKKEQIETGDLVEKVELGRKSPKEREEDVIKIVASVAEVLKSDAPLEEFEGKLPISTFSPYTTTYTTELRETHITTKNHHLLHFLEEERKIAPVHESESDKEDKRSSLLKESQELMMATSKIISEIKSGKSEEKDDSDEAGIVHRMLVTASSEDGGEEIEICPVGTITFSKSSESSGRSSPEKSQELSKKSSIVDTISDSLSTVKQVVELHSEKDSGIDDVKSDTDLESQEKETDAVSTTAIEAGKISPFEKK